MPEMPPEERKRRARAAWGYSLLDQPDFAEAVGVPHRTLEGWLAPGNDKAPPPDKLLRIAIACGRPELATALWTDADQPNIEARVEHLESSHAALYAEFRLSQAEAAQTVADRAADPPPDETRLPDAPSGPDPEATDQEA